MYSDCGRVEGRRRRRGRAGGPLEQPPLPSALSPPCWSPSRLAPSFDISAFVLDVVLMVNRISHPPIWILYFFIIKYK